MRRLSKILCALVLSGAVVAGCGGDGGTSFAEIQLALQDCSQETMTNVMRALFAMLAVPDVIAGEPGLPGFTVNTQPSADIADPPNTWDFSVIFDTNSNGIHDSAIVGKVTFSEDPTDGLTGGATVHFVFDVQNSPQIAGAPVENGTVTGSGDLLGTLGVDPEQVAITGTLSLVDTAGAGCTADLTFAPLNLDLSGALPAQLAANVGDIELFGVIQAIIETIGHTLDAGLTLTNGDQTIDVVGTIDGTDVDFSFELLPADAVISQLLDCAFFGFESLEILSTAFEAVLEAIETGTPPAGVVATPTANPAVYDFTIDLAAFAPGLFTTGTLSGQATATFPPLAGVVPDEVAFTWVFANTTLGGGPTLSGQNTAGRPFRIALDDLGNPVELSGAGSLSITEPPPALSGVILLDCDIDFDIPEADPVLVTGGDGLAIYTVTIGDDVCVLIADFFLEEFIVTINGIPFPFFF